MKYENQLKLGGFGGERGEGGGLWWYEGIFVTVRFKINIKTFPTDLSGDAPEKSLALVAVGGRGGRPEDKVVGGRAGDGVDQSLQCLLEDVHFLRQKNI